MDGVAFELWRLCCKYNAKELAKRLKILYENSYDRKKTTPYIPELFHRVPSVVFDE